MRKLGFEDRLGKDGQGIAQPIATKVLFLLYPIRGRNVPKVWVWELMGLKKQPVFV